MWAKTVRSLQLPSSCVSEESLSSVGMSSLSLKSSDGDGTGPAGPLVSFFSSTTRGTASRSPSGRQSAYSSAGRSNCGKRIWWSYSEILRFACDLISIFVNFFFKYWKTWKNCIKILNGAIMIQIKTFICKLKCYFLFKNMKKFSKGRINTEIKKIEENCLPMISCFRLYVVKNRV